MTISPLVVVIAYLILTTGLGAAMRGSRLPNST